MMCVNVLALAYHCPMQSSQPAQPKFNMTVLPSIYVASIALCAVLVLVGLFGLRLSFGYSILFGIGGMLIHWASNLIHHLGHIMAARSTGYPMSGLRIGTFGGFLGSDVYPANEPALPPRTHVRRALGGPIASLLLALAFGAMTYALSRGTAANAVWYWLAGFGLAENFLFYFAQAILPLGFNDGAVVWRYWGKAPSQPPPSEPGRS
jgi:hypothetical protein